MPNPAVLAMTEKQLHAAVYQAAQLGGWHVYHTHDSRRSDAGFPDLVLVRGHRLMFVELKTEVGRISIEQGEWLQALRTAGVRAEVWRPADLDRVLPMLLSRAEDRDPHEMLVAELVDGHWLSFIKGWLSRTSQPNKLHAGFKRLCAALDAARGVIREEGSDG